MKRFNTAGTCIPEKHYMADTSVKISQIFKMVEEEKYFTIHKPRQYGKTTTLFLLEKQLTAAGFLVIRMSFEGIGDLIFEQEDLFSKKFLKLMANIINPQQPRLSRFIMGKSRIVTDFEQLSEVISQIMDQTSTKTVLIIDEVDKSSNNQLFLSFLGLLRDKYLQRKTGVIPFIV